MKTLRCMAYQQDGVYIAACLDLSLAAQANTIEEAMSKLESQVDDYISEALEDKAHARELLSRRAPLSMWVKYWIVAGKLLFLKKSNVSIFSENCPKMA